MSAIYIYKMFVAKEKALYENLNKMKKLHQSFMGYFWAPQDQEGRIRDALSAYTNCHMLAFDNHKITKPTYFKTNELTCAFQLIVDTYGVPTYREANPALPTIVTFPFLFGMMFSDMGHGSILWLFAAVLCLFSNRLKGSPLEAVLEWRYVFFLMGVMATYCGFIFNEFFGMPTNIFESCFDLHHRRPMPQDGTDDPAPPWVYNRVDYECVYPMGQDPVWGLATDRLNVVNNIKMKLSVIFGILHMSMGICLKGMNAVHFGKKEDLYFEALVGLIILLFLFGWMDVLIFAKWFHHVDIYDTTPYDGPDARPPVARDG